MRIRWGKWEFDPSIKVLRHDDAKYYEVDLEDMETSAAMLDWIFQLHGKTWCARHDIGDLVEALRDLLHPQGTLCSFGTEHGPKDFDICFKAAEVWRRMDIR